MRPYSNHGGFGNGQDFEREYDGFMKAIPLGFVMLVAGVWTALAAPKAGAQTNAVVVAIASAMPTATDIRATAYGYKVVTPAGTRNVYRTSTGYRVEGGGGADNLEIRKTSTGYRIESNLVRGRALGSR